LQWRARGLANLPQRRNISLKPTPRKAFGVADEAQHGKKCGGKVLRWKNGYFSWVCVLVVQRCGCPKICRNAETLAPHGFPKNVAALRIFSGGARACARIGNALVRVGCGTSG